MYIFLTIALQTAVIGIIALGMTYVIITSGIDLSVGLILAISGMVTGVSLEKGMPIKLAIIFGLGAGVLCGVTNGVLISKAHIPPFISTLGIMMILRGLALVLTNGKSIFIGNEAYADIAGGNVLGIPNPVIYFIILSILFAFILKRTVIGKAIYAVESNEEAS